MTEATRSLTKLLNQPLAGRFFTSGDVGAVETPARPEEPESHYGDWPNAQGFDTTYEERTPVELEIEGEIPAYAAGVLFRTGLGPRAVDCGAKGIFRTNHWFDNFAQVHRFQIHEPTEAGGKVRVTYNSRLTSDGLIEQVRKAGRLEGMTFAAKYEPCKTFFQKMQSWFEPVTRLLPKTLPKPNEVNVGVTLSVNFPGLSSVGKPESGAKADGHIASLCTKTDAAVMQMLDSETLEPIGLARQEKLHPELVGPLSGAHAKSDPETGDVYNFNMQFKGGKGIYKIFKVSATTGKAHVLATITHQTAYLHSLFLTENYVVICIWNSYFKAGGAAILWNNNLVDSMEYNQNQPAQWFVVDKRSKEEGGQGVIATYDSPPFFGFHSVNAYEEISPDGTKHIIADIPAYQSMEVLKAFYFDNLLSNSPTAAQVQGQWGDALAPRYRRYRLPDIPSKRRDEVRKVVQEWEMARNDTPELPSVNWTVFTKKHRYVYGVIDSGKSTFADSLAKLDLEDRSVNRWCVQGHTAGEPIFVTDPESNDEDGGVLLSVVLDGISGKSYLLVLNAKDLTELAKAKVDGVIGFGFHGLHTRAVPGSRGSFAPHL